MRFTLAPRVARVGASGARASGGQRCSLGGECGQPRNQVVASANERRMDAISPGVSERLLLQVFQANHSPAAHDDVQLGKTCTQALA